LRLRLPVAATQLTGGVGDDDEVVCELAGIELAVA
jgi:hypothetical protein